MTDGQSDGLSGFYLGFALGCPSDCWLVFVSVAVSVFELDDLSVFWLGSSWGFVSDLLRDSVARRKTTFLPINQFPRLAQTCVGFLVGFFVGFLVGLVVGFIASSKKQVTPFHVVSSQTNLDWQ